MTGPNGTSANRPVRQRNAVLHYSDDNPNTFTVKRRNGVIIDGPASLLASMTADPTTTTTTSSSGSMTPSPRGAAAAESTASTPIDSSKPRQRASLGSSTRAPTPRSLDRRDGGGGDDHDDDDPTPRTSSTDSRRRGRPKPQSSSIAGSEASSVASATSNSSSRRSNSKGTSSFVTTAVGKATSRTAAPEAQLSSSSSSAVLSGATRTGTTSAVAALVRRGSNSSRGSSREREIKSTSSRDASGSVSAVGRAGTRGASASVVVVLGASDARGRSISSNSRKRPPSSASATTTTSTQQHSTKPPPRRSSSLGTAASSSPSAGNPQSRKRKTRPFSPSEKLSGMYGGGAGNKNGNSNNDRDEGDGNDAGEFALGTVIDHQLFYQPLIEATQRLGSGGENSAGGWLLQPPGLSYAASGGGGAGSGSMTLPTTTLSFSASGSWSSLSSALGRPRPLRIPTRLSNHQDLIKDPPVTCWTSRQVEPQCVVRSGDCHVTPKWAACGDASGRVHLVALNPRTAVFASIETAASIRERERFFSSKKSSVSFPNSVLAVAWSPTESVVAVLTDTELECIDLAARDSPNAGTGGDKDPGQNSNKRASSAWDLRKSEGADRTPLAFIHVTDEEHGSSNSSAALSQPMLEWQGDRLLWVLGNGPSPSAEELLQSAVHESSSPGAYVVERSSPSLRPINLPCLAATWDDPQGGRRCDRILALIRKGKDSLALVRYDFQTDQTIQCVELSLAGSVRRVHLQKHHVLVSDGSNQRSTATLVTLCTPRGVHVHSGETLECLSIVGESVALHGKAVSWESCQLVPEPSLDGRRINPSATAASKGTQKQKCWWQLHGDDWNDCYSEMPLPSYQLVAAPQPFKEPKELQSTFHIWRAPPPEAHSFKASFSFHLKHATTLPVPSSPGGILGWSICSDRMGGWRVLGVTAEFGSPFEWNPRFLSDFAGREYPVGYRLLSDNIDYLEDEDEMDQGMVYYEADASSPSSPSLNTPLFATPPRSSSLHQSKELEQVLKRSAEEAPVQVLLSADDEEHDRMEIDSCPPLVIQVDKDRCVETTSEGQISVDAPGSASVSEIPKIAPLLMCFPQYQEALEVSKADLDRTLGEPMSNRLSAPTEVELEVAVANASAMQLKRGKKSRVATVETVLQASVLPDLRSRMNRLMHVWGDGSGSTVAVGTWLSNSSATRSPNRPHARTSKPTFAPGSANGEEASALDTEPRKLHTKDDAMEVEIETIDHPAAEETQPMQLEADVTEGNMTFEVDAKVPEISSDVANRGVEKGSASHDIDSLSMKDRLAQRQGGAKDRVSPSFTSKVSAEERELALELLLLSPGHQRPQPLNESPEMSTSPVGNEADDQNGQSKSAFVSDSGLTAVPKEAPVTPSEQSPSELRRPASPKPQVQPDSSVDFCAACFGRMVVHRCGIREKPIDYDAIERAERERKAREEAEKQQRRIEKRRAAEARRREARKKKKEEDDQKRIEEEERVRLLEAKRIQQVEAQRTRELEVERMTTHAGGVGVQSVPEEGTPSRSFNNWRDETFQPSYSPLKTQVAARLESPAAVPTAHAFRPLDASVEQNELFQQARTEALSSSPKLHHSAGEQHHDLSGIAHLPNGVDDPASAHAGSAAVAHGFSQANEFSSPTIDSDVPKGPVGDHSGSQEQYNANEGTSYIPSNLSVESEYRSDPRSSADVETNTQSSNLMSSFSRATPLTNAQARGLDFTKLEPSAPLSTADALEALAGLANSLPAVPTNVSHNFSSRSWGYEHGPLEQSAHQQSYPNHYYDEQPRYHYQHAGPYAYATDGAGNMGHNWGATAPSYYGHGSAAHSYQATDDHASSSAPSGPLVSTNHANSTGSSSFAMDDNPPSK